MRQPLPSRAERRPGRRAAPALSALALFIAGITGAQAQTWDGGGFGNNWSDSLNWQGFFVVPQPSASTAITFAGSSRLSSVQNIATPFALNSLTFAANAGAFQISGSALRFDGSNARLQQHSGTAVSILNEVQLAANLLVNGTGTVALAGNLSRADGANRATMTLTKQGTGTLRLTGANSYDAAVQIDAGQVQLSHALALQNANVALSVSNGLSFGALSQATLGGLSGRGALALGTTALTIGGADNLGLYGGRLTGTTGSVTKSGSGTARWSGGSEFDNLRVTAGRLQLEGASLGLGSVDQGLMVGNNSAVGSNGPVLAMTGGAKVSATGYTAQVDGATGTLLSLSGANTLLTTGFQALVGNHAIGTLEVADGGRMSAGTYLIFGFNAASNGTLRVAQGGTVTSNVGLLGVQTGSTGNADVAGSGASWITSALGIGGFSTDMRGGSGTLTVRNGGQVQVQGAMTFWSAAAGATVNGGSLRAGSLASEGAVGSIALQANPTGGSALVLDGAVSSSFAGTLSGDGSLLKTGSGAQTLAGASPAFTGTTTIQGGRIVVGHQDALRGSRVQLNISNGLDLNGLPQATVVSLSGIGALALGNTALTIAGNDVAGLYSGAISGSAGSVTKAGSGTARWSGKSGFDKLQVTAGRLQLEGASLGLGSNVQGLLVGNGSGVGSNGPVLALSGGAKVSATGYTAQVDGASGTLLSISGVGTLLSTGVQALVGYYAIGTLEVADGGTLAADIFLTLGYDNGSDGTLRVAQGGTVTSSVGLVGVLTGSTGTADVAGSNAKWITNALAIGGRDAGLRGGAGTLTVRDGGLVQVRDTLTFWSAATGVTVNGGSLRAGGLVSNAGGLITLSADPVDARALTLGTTGGSFNYGGDIDGDGGLLKTGTSTQVLGGRNSFTGMVQVQGGTLQMATSAASEYEVSGGTLRLGERNLGWAVLQAGPGAQIVYTHTTLNGGLLIGPGGHDISAVRRMVGTRVSNGTVLAPAAGTTFVGVVNDGLVDLRAGRSLVWTGGSNATGRLAVAGTASVSSFSSGGQIDVAPGGALVSTSGDLVLGGGSRTTVGTVNQPGGTVELRAGGRLQLNGGLLVNNGAIVGPVEVNFGSLAKGAGVYGQVSVNDGGRFSPGNSPGTVTTGDATWGAGGGLVVELASAGGTAGLAWDLWNISGSLSVLAGTTANSQFTISLATLDGSNQSAALAGFDASRAWQWRIVDTNAGILGFDTTRVALDTRGFLSPLAGGRLELAVQDGDLYLQFAPVPEPQTWALMLGGLAALGWRARRLAARRP